MLLFWNAFNIYKGKTTNTQFKNEFIWGFFWVFFSLNWENNSLHPVHFKSSWSLVSTTLFTMYLNDINYIFTQITSTYTSSFKSVGHTDNPRLPKWSDTIYWEGAPDFWHLWPLFLSISVENRTNSIQQNIASFSLHDATLEALAAKTETIQIQCKIIEAHFHILNLLGWYGDYEAKGKSWVHQQKFHFRSNKNQRKQQKNDSYLRPWAMVEMAGLWFGDSCIELNLPICSALISFQT